MYLLRTDKIRKPQEVPYLGPHKVNKKEKKTFKIETLVGHKQILSIERMKPVKFTRLIKAQQKTHHLHYLKYSKTRQESQSSRTQAEVFVLKEIMTTSTTHKV